MGRLVLDQYLHKEFSESMLKAKNLSKPLHECEKEAIGFDHGDVGAWLGRKWGLPEPLIVSMQYHHFEQSVPESLHKYREMVFIVNWANRLSLSAGIGSSGDAVYNSLGQCSIEGKTGKQIREILDKIRNEVRSTMDEWNKAL
jgi:HD-like signal output (HDOD) protein